MAMSSSRFGFIACPTLEAKLPQSTCLHPYSLTFSCSLDCLLTLWHCRESCSLPPIVVAKEVTSEPRELPRLAFILNYICWRRDDGFCHGGCNTAGPRDAWQITQQFAAFFCLHGCTCRVHLISFCETIPRLLGPRQTNKAVSSVFLNLHGPRYLADRPNDSTPVL